MLYILKINKNNDDFVYQHNLIPKDNDDQNVQRMHYIVNNVLPEEVYKIGKYDKISIQYQCL